MPDIDTITFNAGIIEEFRAHQGQVGGPFAGATMLLLTTTGARSGQRRTSPLAYRREGSRIFVYATNNGRDEEPSWLRNLRADPRVEVELGPGDGPGEIRRFAARALPLAGPERDAVWARQASEFPRFADYQLGTAREIAVVELIEPDPDRQWALGDQLRLAHADLRSDLAEVRRQADALAAGDGRPGGERDGAARLRRHCLAFCDAIGAHHTGEDTLGFPRLERQVPELAPVVARLRAEHVRVADLQQRLRAAMTNQSDPVHTRELVLHLTDELERHFDYEEQHLVATLNALDTTNWGVPDRR
jgi:deazaflavin-dependent oxidoreductase (nitroreductase family)